MYPAVRISGPREISLPYLTNRVNTRISQELDHQRQTGDSALVSRRCGRPVDLCLQSFSCLWIILLEVACCLPNEVTESPYFTNEFLGLIRPYLSLRIGSAKQLELDLVYRARYFLDLFLCHLFFGCQPEGSL